MGHNALTIFVARSFALFSMIYTVGVSNSLYVFGVAEPLSHQSDHFFAKTGYRSQDEIDLFAITMTVTDWGPGGWAVVTVVGVALSLAAYRFKLPMSYRSIFYPILGHYTWGWMGDLIDGFAVVAGLAGMFTALGMAAVNFVAGFAYMGWIDLEGSEGQVAAIQSSIIWVLSTISLASAISGLHGGIQKSCILAVALGSLLMLLVFAMDDTKYLLNLQVQELGTYLQSSVLQLNFWTDAFGQLRDGSGRAVDGKAAEQWWYLYWMNFGQTWWYVPIPTRRHGQRQASCL
jgi:choline/glycine/proline betaine transport protein